MMAEWVLSSSLLIAVVLILRAALGKKISAALRYGLWAVVLVRLLVPVSFITLPGIVPRLPAIALPEFMQEDSIFILPVNSSPLEKSGVYVLEDGRLGDSHSFGYPKLDDSGKTVVRYADRISPLELLGWIWAAGAAAMGTILAVSNLHFFIRLRRVRKPLAGTAAPIPVYTAAGIPSPCLAGLLRPAVYVTDEVAANPAMLRHVLAHELTHYNHLDHLWSVLRGAALAAHWWNPLVWLAVVCSRRDGELACDEGALKRLGDGERTAYGETLLTLVTAKGKPGDLLYFATTMTGGKRSLKERIRRIAQQPKRLLSAVVAVVVVLAVTTLASFAQAKAEPDAEPDADEPPSVESRTGAADHPDLDHDGLPDKLEVRQIDEEAYTMWKLEFTASGMTAPAWEGEAASVHVGWTSYYLCQVDGKDYLLQYTPYMSGGDCCYTYKLFYLTPGGGEVVVQENKLEFDLIFAPWYADQHHFDPEAIVAFMSEINRLLKGSELLVNTDENLIGTFQKEGRLYDSLWWLDDGLDDAGYRRSDRDLLSALTAYARYAGIPAEAEVLAMRKRVEEGMSEDEIARLVSVVFQANNWFEHRYFYDNIFQRLSDPEDLYWNYFEETGKIQIGWAYDAAVYGRKEEIKREEGLSEQEFNEKYGTGVATTNAYTLDDFISVLEELKASVRSGLLDEDFDRMMELCANAKESHNFVFLNELFRMLHDMDYFLLRYGVSDVGPYAGDDSWVAKYFGSLAVWA